LNRLVLTVGFCFLAVAGGSMAQQGQPKSAAGPAVAEPLHDPADTGGGAASGQRNTGTGSYRVEQETTDEDATPVVIRSTTRRVVVNVVVTGPDGKPVAGLAQNDFTVEEDRKPQSVKAFESYTPEEARSALPPAPAQLPNHIFVNLEQTPASGPPVAVLLDFLNTSLTDQAYAHEQIVRFLERKQASTEVAIFALGDSLSLVQGFTTDKEKLLSAMRSKEAKIRIAATSEDIAKADTTLDAFLDLGRFLTTVNGRKNLLWFSESFDMMVLPKASDADNGALITSYESGSPNPGPGPTADSATLLSPLGSGAAGSSASATGFSHGIGDLSVLREKMRKVATALAVSQTAVYPIDVRGLAVDPGFSAAPPAPTSLTTLPKGMGGTPGMPTAPGAAPAAVQRHNDFMQSLNGTQATMEEIAEATGGRAFVNTNGIAEAAIKAVADGSSYYTLVYAPSNLNFDGGLRTIRVKLDKPGCHLSYRSAYYAVDPARVAPEAVDVDELAAALVHGAPDAQSIVFKAQIDPDGAPSQAAPDSSLAVKAAPEGGKGAGKKSKGAGHLSGLVQQYRIRLAIVARQLHLTPMADGRYRSELEVAVCSYAADGRKLGGTRQKLEAAMPPDVYAQALQNGMFHNLQVELPVEAASLRLAIVDMGSRRTGSLEVSLPLAPSQEAHAAPAMPLEK
jgi:VWFA-related protein